MSINIYEIGTAQSHLIVHGNDLMNYEIKGFIFQNIAIVSKYPNSFNIIIILQNLPQPNKYVHMSVQEIIMIYL